MRLIHYAGFGQTLAPLNTPEVEQMVVRPSQPLLYYPKLDAALDVHGIPSDQSDRVPERIRATLTSTTPPAEVDTVQWGGGSGLESIRGKIYVRWRPDKVYNAVDYANVARRLFQRAADGFPAGAQIVMNRYRIVPLIGADSYVYPSADQALPPSAPDLARGVDISHLPPVRPQPETECDFECKLREELEKIDDTVKYGLAAGAVVTTAGLGAWWYFAGRKAKVSPNRRRPHRRRRTSR